MLTNKPTFITKVKQRLTSVGPPNHFANTDVLSNTYTHTIKKIFRTLLAQLQNVNQKTNTMTNKRGSTQSNTEIPHPIEYKLC